VLSYAATKSVVFSWELNGPGESIERRSGLSELSRATHTEKAHDVKLRGNWWFEKLISNEVIV